MTETGQSDLHKTRLFDAAGRRLLVLGLVVALLFIGAMLRATDARFVPQIVDLYITCQYAKALAEGHPFEYNPGEKRSTGATSLLHTAILGAAHALGAQGEGLVAFAIACGVLFYLVTLLLARRLAAMLGGEREGLLAGALVALGGPVVWGFLYGADVALYMLLATWLFERLVAERRRAIPRGAIAALSLLALARPEGAAFAAVLAPILWLRSAGRASQRARLVIGLPLVVALLVLTFNRAATGSWLGTSLTDKSLVANYGLADGAALSAEYLADVARGLLFGFYPSSASIGFARGFASLYFPPLALVFILLALACPRRVEDAYPLRLWAGLVALLFAVVTPNLYMGVHYNRYLMWAFPSLHALFAVGLGRAASLVSERKPEHGAAFFRAYAALAIGLGFLSTLRFAAVYGDMAGAVYSRDVQAAEWIRKNLPPGATMANVATSVEYLTGHRNLNLHGVTCPAFFGNRLAEREAGVWEALGRLPADNRPEYLITTVSAQDAYPSLRALVAEPPLYLSRSLSDEILIYRMNLEPLGRAHRPWLTETRQALQGWREVDRLNVCDAKDENAHAYSYRSRLAGARLWGTVRSEDYGAAIETGAARVIDAGRVILGQESFSIRTMPGRALLVVLRTASSADASILRASGAKKVTVELSEAEIALGSAGRVLARSTFRPRPGWDEHVLFVPADAIVSARTRLELSGHYASFYYWVFQR